MDLHLICFLNHQQHTLCMRMYKVLTFGRIAELQSGNRGLQSVRADRRLASVKYGQE